MDISGDFTPVKIFIYPSVMVKVTIYFVATLVSFLLHTRSTQASNLDLASKDVDAFKPLTMPVLVEKTLDNSRKITNLSSDLSPLPIVNFAVSHDLLASIIPFEDEKKIFLLPETPTASTISKLIFVLSVNSKRLGLMSTVIRQYTHYDSVSRKMFQNVSLYKCEFILF